MIPTRASTARPDVGQRTCAGSCSDRPSSPTPSPARDDRADDAAAAALLVPSTAAAASSRGCSTRTSSSRPYGLRSLSRGHREHPFSLRPRRPRARRSTTSPAESTHRHVRRQLQLARAGLVPGQLPAHRARCAATPTTSATTSPSSIPTGSGQQAHARRGRRRPARRLISLFLAAPTGRRPSTAASTESAPDPLWTRAPDCSTSTSTATTARGLGATHQTGWTALVAHLICSPDGRLHAPPPPPATPASSPAPPAPPDPEN